MLALRKINAGIRRSIENSDVKQELDHLTGMHGWIICYLADHAGEDIYQRDLEKNLCLCRSAVSKIVALMEKNGLIERARVASDERLKKLVLTERGRQYTDQVRADCIRIEQQLTAGFSSEERRLLLLLLERMRNNITEE